MLPQSPCKDCPDRYLGCHDRCEKYQQFKVDLVNAKNELNNHSEIDAYRLKSVRRSRVYRENAKKWKKKV